MSRLSLALPEMQRIYGSAGDGGGGEEVSSEDHSPRNEMACMSLDHRCGAGMRRKELQGGGILEGEGRKGCSRSFSHAGPAGGA